MDVAGTPCATNNDSMTLKIQQIPTEPKQRLMEEIFEVHFDFNKATVKPEYAEVVQKLAETARSSNNVKISVVVQKMVQSDVSGVMFSMDPVTGAKDRIIIESVWGLGEMIVQGSVVPDKYVVQKETFDILSKEISDQDHIHSDL